MVFILEQNMAVQRACSRLGSTTAVELGQNSTDCVPSSTEELLQSC